MWKIWQMDLIVLIHKRSLGYPGQRHKPHFTSQDLVKNTSLERGLPVLGIKIPFGIHLLGS